MAIVNFKSIFTSGFDQDALTTATSGGHILNFASLTTTGDLANGIYAGANNVSIFNFGPIETFGLGAYAIFVEGDNARVENFGPVVTHADDSIEVHGDNFIIANHGNIRTDGDFASALVGIGSNGVIINYGLVDSNAFNGAEVFVFGDGARVTNAGTVTARGEDMAALEVVGLGGAATNLLNLGHVLVTGNGTFGLEVRDFGGQGTNTGDIVVTADAAVAMITAGDGNVLENSGLIQTDGTFTSGMVARFADTAELVNDGRIITQGDLAIGVALGLRSAGFGPATNGTIINRGLIDTQGDGAAGAIMAGDGHQLANSGRITANGGAIDALGVMFHAAGVVVSGDGAVIENAQTGVIESKSAASAAVELNVLQRTGVINSALSSLLDNDGLIKGASVAVLGSAGQETVVNHGRIVGDVVLGDGNDTFVFGKGGSLAGELFLGGGDDLVGVEKGSGSMRIADFTPGDSSGDVIDISAFYSNFTDLMSHSQQVGNNVVVGLGHNDQLVLENVKRGVLNADDFQFSPTLLGNYMASSFVSSGSLSGGAPLADTGMTESEPISQHLAPRVV
jgi:hypothetical protein